MSQDSYEYKVLVNTLRLWSLAYPENRLLFNSDAELLAELFSSIDNMLIHLPKVIDSELVSGGAVAAIIRTYIFAQSLPETDASEPPATYFNRDEWRRVAVWARKALDMIGVEPDTPDVNYI